MSRLRTLGCLSLLLVLPGMGMAQKQSKNMVPVVNAISPNNAIAGSPSFTMTVTGSNFTNGSSVQWNGSSLSTTVLSSTQLQVTVSSSLIGSQGTARVTVYTSGRWGGTSNSVAFAINAPPASSTTTTTTTTSTTTTTTTTSGDTSSSTSTGTNSSSSSTTALEITSTSVPSGTQDTDYSADLAASGGSPAYTWGLISSAGALPQGLSLGADGKIIGKPSQAGTFPFTAIATDQAGQVVQKQFSLVIAAAPTTTTTTTSPSSGMVFATGFEAGDPPVPSVSGPNVRVASGVSNSGSNALQATFNICGDSANSACGLAHQDQGGYAKFLFNSTNGYPNGFDHVFVRAYVRFHFNPGETTQAGIGRKLFYFLDANNTWHGVAATTIGSPNLVLSFNYGSQAIEDTIANRVELCYPNRVGNCTTTQFSLVPDAWYYLEVEVQVNTPGAADGKLNMWVQRVGVDSAPSNVVSATNVNIRGNATTGIGWIQIGDQVDRQNWQVVDESRWWDDIAISQTGPIGPVGQ